MHILLADDNLHDVFFVQHALQEVAQPVELSVVQDGEHTLNFLFRAEPYSHVAPPDIVLLDLNMPRKTGMEVLAARGHDPRLKCIPVIMFTTSTLPHDINRCYELGANAYIAKPMGLPQLVTALKRIINFWESCELYMPMRRK
jgi:chemotaxis family two-component system response regulator Rcp1